jgi:hypothetical protein
MALARCMALKKRFAGVRPMNGDGTGKLGPSHYSTTFLFWDSDMPNADVVVEPSKTRRAQYLSI